MAQFSLKDQFGVRFAKREQIVILIDHIFLDLANLHPLCHDLLIVLLETTSLRADHWTILVNAYFKAKLFLNPG